MEITISCQQNSPGNSYMTNYSVHFLKLFHSSYTFIDNMKIYKKPSCEPLPSSYISLSRNPESCHPNLESRTVRFQARLSEFASFATYLRRHIGRSWATCAPSRFKGLFVENAALCFISHIHLSGTWLTFDLGIEILARDVICFLHHLNQSFYGKKLILFLIIHGFECERENLGSTLLRLVPSPSRTLVWSAILSCKPVTHNIYK